MRKTVQHLTWGEEERKHVSAADENGLAILLTFAIYKTLCRRLNDDSRLPPDPAPSERPEGVCKPCWKRFIKDLASAYLES